MSETRIPRTHRESQVPVALPSVREPGQGGARAASRRRSWNTSPVGGRPYSWRTAPPGSILYVVRDGTMELDHKGHVVDVVTKGQVFGHPTVITGLAPEFTVRAREDTVLYLIPRDVALDVPRPSRRRHLRR